MFNGYKRYQSDEYDPDMEEDERETVLGVSEPDEYLPLDFEALTERQYEPDIDIVVGAIVDGAIALDACNDEELALNTDEDMDKAINMFFAEINK